MKNIFLVFAFLAVSSNAFAHFLWVETKPIGKINQKHEVKVFFGEYTYGVSEKVGEEAFNAVKNFTLWAVAPNGEKTELETKAGELFYSASFTPNANGTYTIIADNDTIDVIDYTQYNFGIFKTHYHCLAKVEVSGTPTETAAINPDGIAIVDVSKKIASENSEVTLKIVYKGAVLKEKEVDVFVRIYGRKKSNPTKTDWLNSNFHGTPNMSSKFRIRKKFPELTMAKRTSLFTTARPIRLS